MSTAGRSLLRAGLALSILYGTATLLAGWWFPGLLLNAPLPRRASGETGARLAALAGTDGRWTLHPVRGSADTTLQVHWLHRPRAEGVAVLLHGFGDDALGTAPRLRDLPDLEAVCFTFRGRDLVPGTPSTLGGHERSDVAAVVQFLEAKGWPRSRQVLVGVSQGAGVALLALADLERQGAPLAGALLESPFMDLRDAARHHLRGTLGPFEILARPAERIGLWRAGRMAGFDPDAVSPLRASRGLRTPVALLAGAADPITPLPGVQAIATNLPDLTVVPGADHLEAGSRLPGGWRAWADPRLRNWGLR
ncbi:MAG: alpha/beta fold hydrolase [Holophagaceae bacterium]